MRNFTSLLIFLTISLQSFTQDKQWNNDWISKDEKNFKNLMSAIQSEDNLVDSFLNKLEHLSIRENLDGGFSEHRYTCAQYGGYITHWITINTVNKVIYNLTIRIDPTDVAVIDQIASYDSIVDKELKEHWKKEKFGEQEIYKYEYFNEILFKELISNIEIELGRIDSDINKKYQKDYELLTSPKGRYDFGNYCYESGSEPSGRLAIKTLVNANQTELIKKAMRGYNSEGRLYAIEALLQQSTRGKIELTEEDKNIIKLVLNLNIKINTCQGCIISSELAKEIFMQEDLLKLLTANEIKLK